METPNKVIRKKSSRVFETYISKILKTISSSNGITANSKQQTNSVLSAVSKLICEKVFILTEISKKKTISDKEIRNSIKILFPTKLANSIIENGDIAIDNFNNKELSKGVSRQDKACIIFPPSQSEKFLRNFGYSKTMVTSNAPVFLAGSLEYFATIILKNAVEQARNNKRVRVTIRDLEIAVRNDEDMDMFFTMNKICFLGGGVKPFIYHSLLKKKNRKKKVVKKSDDLTETETETNKKKHRFRPGTVSIREIKKFQKLSNSLTFAKFPFEKILRETINKLNTENTTVKISKDVFTITQYFLEQRLIEVLKNCNFAAIHANRVKLMPIDIKFVSSLSFGMKNPYTKNIDSLNEICETQEIEFLNDENVYEEECDENVCEEEIEEECEEECEEELDECIGV